MKRFFALLLAILLLCTACSRPSADGDAPLDPEQEETVLPSEDLEEESPQPPEPTVATLAVCGDAMSHMPLTNDAWDAETQRYDYLSIMEAARPYVEAADYALVNLETTLAGGPDYSGYPRFNAPDDLALDLKELGFDLLLTANNHCMDRGFSGLCRTLDVLDELGLAHVGTSRTEEEYASNVVVADVGGISVAFLGYTYGTNGIALPGDASFAVNLFNVDYLTNLSDLDEDKLLSDLAEAKALGTDLVAVLIHWGWEYHTTQNSYQEQIADLLFANGADLILGGHSHVPQPMELRTVTLEDGTTKQGFVCYSLGNFISAQNDRYTDTTAVLTLELTRDNVTGVTQVTGYSYAPLLMLDREAGAVNRFELLDAYAAAEDTSLESWIREKAAKAIEDCRAIFGAEGDLRCAAGDGETE